MTQAAATRGREKSKVLRTTHTDDVLAELYRLGGGTIEQIGRLLGHLNPGRWKRETGPYNAAKRTLGLARQEGLVEVLPVHREWAGRSTRKAETFYRLRRERGGAGIVAGAVAAGVSFDKPAEALDHYARNWSGGGVLHAAHKVDYYLALLEGAALSGGVIGMDPEEVSGESHPSYPLVGWPFDDVDAAGRPRRRGARGTQKFHGQRNYARVVPDGEFACAFALEGDDHPSLECEYHVEIERRTKAGVVVDKVERYAGYWRRVLEDDGVLAVRPIIVVHHDPRRAARANPREGTGAPAMRNALHERLYASEHFAALDGEIRKRDPESNLGRMVLVCDWHEVADKGAFAPVYHAVAEYPEESDPWAVDLGAAAADRDGMLSWF